MAEGATVIAYVLTDWARGFTIGFILGCVAVIVVSDLLGGYE